MIAFSRVHQSKTNAHSGTGANRYWIARDKHRCLSRRPWIDQIIRDGLEIAKSLHDADTDALRSHSAKLREFMRDSGSTPDARLLSLAAGAVTESIRRSLGLQLFQTQIHAGIIVSMGGVAEMQTGEGKTLSVILPAYLHALTGRGVHVATPNDYLAKRDHEKISPVLQTLGISTGLLGMDADEEHRRRAYQADVTYGPGHVFGFDYLRDQLTLQRHTSFPLGLRTLQRLHDASPAYRLLQRGLHAAIIDEVDQVLIDDAISPLLLSEACAGESPDAEVHRHAKSFTQTLSHPQHYQIESNRSVTLTDAGFQFVYQCKAFAQHPGLLRPWHEYVVLALRAKHCFQINIDYVIQDDQVQIVDPSTGRIYSDRTWSDGLHQAIQAKEGIRVSPESRPLARITRQRFFRYYQTLGGMTGTAGGCKREFSTVYGMPVEVVPLRVPSQRTIWPDHVCVTCDEKLNAIAEETLEVINAGRAVLIGTHSIDESWKIAAKLKQHGLEPRVLNGIQDETEASIIARAGSMGAVTVATNLAGRGTDIALDPAVRRQGGLHVIVSQRHPLERVDRQLIGRCARCGDPGTARTFVSADDTLPAQLAPWIGRSIRRCCPRERHQISHLHKRFHRAQQEQQRIAASQRWRLLQADREDERLLETSEAPFERGYQR